MLKAKAEADKIVLIGKAKAAVIEAKADAECEGLRLSAEAFKHFTDAAKLRLILDCLPNMAAEIAAPLAKTKEIVILGGGSEGKDSSSLGTIASLGRDFMRLNATIPPGVRAVTGVDLTKVVLLYIFSQMNVILHLFMLFRSLVKFQVQH